MTQGSPDAKKAALLGAVPKPIQKHPLRTVGALAAAYCLGVAGVSVYTLVAVRMAVTDIDAYLRCCHGLWEMVLTNMIVPPIALGVLGCAVLNKDATHPRHVSELNHIKVTTVLSTLLLLGTFLPILAVTGTRALDSARPAECAALIDRATAGGPPLLITVNLFYLASNSVFCAGCILLLWGRFSRRKDEYAKHAAAAGGTVVGGNA